MKTKRHKKARSVRVRKAVKLAPNEVLLEVVIAGVPEPPSEVPPVDSIELDATDHLPAARTWAEWFKGLW